MRVAVIVGAILLAIVISLAATVAIRFWAPEMAYHATIANEKARAQKEIKQLEQKINEVDKLRAEMKAADAERKKIEAAAATQTAALDRELAETRNRAPSATAPSTLPGTELQKANEELRQKIEMAQADAERLQLQMEAWEKQAELTTRPATLPARR
jgi:hypothetical protein